MTLPGKYVEVKLQLIRLDVDVAICNRARWDGHVAPALLLDGIASCKVFTSGQPSHTLCQHRRQLFVLSNELIVSQ